MNNELSQIDLYITVDDAELNRLLKESVAPINLDAVVHQALQEAGVTQPVMLTLMITDDATLRDMNKQYRQQDKPTDVLSFPLQDRPLVNAPPEQLWQPSEESAAGSEPNPPFVSPPDQPTNLGDIAISWPTLLRQARAEGHDPAYELVFLIAHGVLHLVGYDDQTEAGYQAMMELQRRVLAALKQQG